MQPTIEKSQEQAAIIQIIRLHILQLDPDYLKGAAETFASRASMNQSIAALNPRRLPEEDKLLLAKANALTALVNYIDSLKKIDKVEEEIGLAKESQHRIDKIFNPL